MSLASIIADKIKIGGPISFYDFMGMALYYPELGYYTSPGSKIGQRGDYITVPHLSPVLGAMLGKQIEEMWILMGRPDHFTILEYGAGTGLLCDDILGYLKQNQALYEAVYYCIVEKSPASLSKTNLKYPQTKVRFCKSAEEVGDVEGLILSNELVDNFAVHRIVMEDGMKEIFVDYTDSFKEILIPAPAALINYMDEMGVTLPEGFRTEVNLEAADWVKDAATMLKKGWIITIDYGFASDEMYIDKRNNGTLMCYYKHQLSTNPYLHIGEQDITSHVNFSALAHFGNKCGLTTCGLTSQAGFLLSLDFKSWLRHFFEKGKDIVKSAFQEALLTRTLLLDMGVKFKVLIQQKQTGSKNLSGLQFGTISIL
ncbi:class I SAM-dependent methyltransferase [Foetidibacter luteolus]|uniref:class I SAM-dependent methyltransferase n=1 Tax=Foetidibacter luteolus TaxID=2608880 RepID=UPI00129BAA25|nr:SAM-dependent methyltransferase [Foetidibacter luteolus]